MFTRKHYEKIADILKEHRESNFVSHDLLADKFAELFAEDNPRFDRTRFIEAVRFGSKTKDL